MRNEKVLALAISSIAALFFLPAYSLDVKPTCPCNSENVIAQAPQPAPAFQRKSSSTDEAAGAQSTTLRSGTESTTLQSGTAGGLIQGQVEQEKGPVNILFLVDSSYSMKEGLGGGTPKMEAAKQVLQNAMTRIPSDVNVGLRVFGHQFEGNPAIDCQQTALLVPIETGNRRSIIEHMRQVKPYGLTPLTYALRQAAIDLRPLTGTKTIILLSDGAETCGGDPCAFITRLEEMGIKLKIDIVGLGLRRDKEARAQLNCVATASGGKFYDANTASELIDSVSKSVNTAISGHILTKMKGSAGSTDVPAEEEILKPLLGH